MDSIWLFLIFATLQFADAALTLRILARGGAELNPIMCWVFRRVGACVGLATVKLALLVIVFVALPWLPVWLLVVMCAGYALIVGHNWIQARR